MTSPPAPRSMRRVFIDGTKIISRFVRWHPVSFALAVVGAAIFASAIVASAVVIGRVTDELILPVLERGVSPSGLVLPAVAAVVGVSLWKAIGISIRRASAGWLQYRTQADVRKALIDHQLRLDLHWHSRQTTGNLLSVSETDARMATFVLAPLPYATGASLLLIGTVVLIGSIDWVLGLITLVALVGVVAVDLWGGWKMHQHFQTAQRRRGEVSAIAHESFDGALTVKALGREDLEGDRFQSASEDLSASIATIGRIWGTYRSFVEAVPPLATVTLMVVGAARVGGAVDAGDLVTVAYLMSLLTFPIQLLGFVLWEMASSVAAWDRVSAVLRSDELRFHGDVRAKVGEGDGAPVDAAEVGFGFGGEQPVLRGLDLDIPAGVTVALVGPTASGKSTMAMLLARLWDPDTGRIHLEGRDLRDFGPAELPLEVALVAQEAFLFDDSVRGNITLGLEVDDDEVQEAASLAAADDFILEMPDGYDTLIGERGMTLSGGQRQRIALARAIVRRPRLLILDDATSAVDPSVEAGIIRSLRREELPSTVLLVAHRRSAITLADEVAYIEDGQIVAYGTHDELLFSQPGYARLLRAYEEDAQRRAQRKRSRQ